MFRELERVAAPDLVHSGKTGVHSELSDIN